MFTLGADIREAPTVRTGRGLLFSYFPILVPATVPQRRVLSFLGCSNIHYHTGPAHCYPRLESSPPASGRGSLIKEHRDNVHHYPAHPDPPRRR